MRKLTILILLPLLTVICIALAIAYYLSPTATLAIAVVALILTALNAAFGILNVVMSRFRFLTVTDIDTVYSSSIYLPKHSMENKFSVDVLCWGAAIWDISAEILFQFPLNETFVKAGCYGTWTWKLNVTKAITPLAAGQALRFECKYVRLMNDPSPHPMMHPYITPELLAQLPKRNISLCIYTNDRPPTTRIKTIGDEPRHLLYRVRSRNLYVALSSFTNGAIACPPPTLWQRFSSRIEKWREQRHRAYIKRIRGDVSTDGPLATVEATTALIQRTQEGIILPTTKQKEPQKLQEAPKSEDLLKPQVEQREPPHDGETQC